MNQIIGHGTLLVKPATLHKRIEHGDHVLRRDVGQDVVDLLEDETAAAVQIHLPANVPRISPARPCVHEPRVATAAPERHPAAEIGLQPGRVHAGAGDLHRIHRVQAGLDQVGNNGRMPPQECSMTLTPANSLACFHIRACRGMNNSRYMAREICGPFCIPRSSPKTMMSI